MFSCIIKITFPKNDVFREKKVSLFKNQLPTVKLQKIASSACIKKTDRHDIHVGLTHRVLMAISSV